MKPWILPVAIALGLTACGGSEDSNTDAGNGGAVTPPLAQAPSVELGPDQQTWNHETLSLTASVTLFNPGTASYQWQQTSGPSVKLSGLSSDTLTLDASDLLQDEDIVLSLKVTDAAGLSSEDSLTLKLKDKISAASQSGDASLIEGLEPKVIARGLKLIQDYRGAQKSFLNTIYQADRVSYDSGQHSQMIQMPLASKGFPLKQSFELVRGNQGRLFAAASDLSGQRNAAFGTDIISSMQGGNNLGFEPSMMRLLSWLTGEAQANLAATKQVRLFLISDWSKSRVTNWLTSHYPNWQVSRCDVASELASCLGEAELVITGSIEAFDETEVSTRLEALQQAKIPLLYLHMHAWNSVPLTQTVLGAMGFAMQGPGGPGNYFSPDKADWSDYLAMQAANPALNQEALWLELLQSENPSFNLANCADTCDSQFSEEYRSALAHIRSSINRLDTEKTAIFDSPEYQLYKYLILLGDRYRSEIDYPMDVSTTAPMSYLKALFADSSVYNSRRINPVPADLGNFSRTDFSHVTPVDKTVALSSKAPFRAAGVYALPGQTFSVTRTDNSQVETKVFINTQRSGSTQEYASKGYNRPKYLQSPAIAIKPGETITLTSPYGGPVQIRFNANDLPVEFTFSHVGLHPFWRSDKDDQAFIQGLAKGDYDWAELATEHFEVHSRLNKMQETMSHEPRWDTPQKMSEAISTFVHNYPHLLAGFKGPGIDSVDEITNFAASKGWQLDQLDMVKHMNADQPTCGSGCSGNPYDASWSFSPTGHGDIHELGHGLERGRLRFDGHEGHASTNPYSYYTKSRAYLETGKLPECQGLSIQDEFDVLQASQRQADPFAYVQAANLTSWSSGMATMLQTMIAAQKQGALQNGWHLLARLHILLREFERAQADEASWLAKRDQLGFGSFDLASAKALSNNDFLMIAMSFSTGLDYRDFYQMWGLATSDAAKAQVASFAYPAVPKSIYVYAPGDYCYGLDLQAVAVDGEQAWPL
ncbi:ImpA family metalloprotease [Shewanella rhizosphaerae]|uniref:ImpA family metalloprotease n=1 Tax=Shewanella rhizosphaerae TaxID=2864207 RepID=UPI001C657B85|nr:ImpA family metalloprotease [Shewanella rhizosphaerae]QYK13828.1 ImpA family metalloprotease [Shewanella rhizosphaerae]